MGGLPTVVELMKAVKYPGWRWDPFIRALRNDEFELVVRPSEIAKYNLEDAQMMELTLMGYEIQAKQERPKKPPRR